MSASQRSLLNLMRLPVLHGVLILLGDHFVLNLFISGHGNDFLSGKIGLLGLGPTIDYFLGVNVTDSGQRL